MDGFLYQYGIGGLIFAVGVAYAWRQGYVGLSGRKLVRLLVLFSTLLIYAAIQGYLQYAPMSETPAKKFDGEFQRPETHGTPLDYAIMIGYFAIILGIGTWFSRKQKTTKDFFFSGQRFSWWLIMVSLIATTIGSYSFVKYSRVAYDFGVGSSQTYFNDWIWLPLLLFGWLPILYFSRITSVPEYFERRFNRPVRAAATVLVLVYLVSYVGVNLFTMGKVFNTLLGWDILTAAMIVATISAIYVTAGGQTSVIMTDLFQGIMLLATGLIILALGCWTLGGFDEFWELLPRNHRRAFPVFNEDASFPSVGIFWQDAIANTAMFYFLNQGILMRFMSAKSVNESRKAMFAVVLVLMPIAACVVASGGWVAKALVQAGRLPADIDSGEAFFVVSEFLSRPGLFGLILAALTAALMSTVDTLITAVAAVTVNDVYKLYLRPSAPESELLRVARITSVIVTIIGVALVPVYMQFNTIYEAHGAMTAAVTPPLVVTLLFAVFWRRFTSTAALCTLVGGMLAIGLSIIVPDVIWPFAHGVDAGEKGDGFLGGMSQFKFMRAFFGIVVCSVIGVVVTCFTKRSGKEKLKGLVWGTVSDAIHKYKGTPGDEFSHAHALAAICVDTSPPGTELKNPDDESSARISAKLAEQLQAAVGDLIFVSDQRWWFGGLRSTHARVSAITLEADSATIELDERVYGLVVSRKRQEIPVLVERFY